MIVARSLFASLAASAAIAAGLSASAAEDPIQQVLQQRQTEWSDGFDAAASQAPARKELWKWVLISALAVLVFEWYIYNRRVYL